MDRRNFFKIVSTVSAGVATNACGDKTNQLIPLLVPDHEIVPGQEQWHAAHCGECGAGCGIIARIMEGERVIERGNEKFRERIACVKKVEGDPADAISGGRLCARGHAVLQSLYNPDRLRGPLKRTGQRGKAQFAPVSWDAAIKLAAEKLGQAKAQDAGKILTLGRPTAALNSFLQALGAPLPRSAALDSFALEKQAARLVFGWQGMPNYDLAQAHHVLGIGADFLGGWASPVYYARQFGHFRQGRSDIRGMLLQAESRMSLTSASADEWLPIRPGSEVQFTLAIARLLLDAKLARHADLLPASVVKSIEAADLASLIAATGLPESRLHAVARQLGESSAPLVLAGASVAHTNSLDALVTACYLNLLLGNIGQPGGVFAPVPQPNSTAAGNVAEACKQARVLLLNGANPAYTLPAASGIEQALTGMDLIVSFGSFIDDSAAYADLILPDHHALETDLATIVRPLYDTRPLEQTLNEIARKLNVTLAAPIAEVPQAPLAKPADQPLQIRAAIFAGAPAQFPYQFQPYLSLQYHDGGGANLPWMQELPDPTSSAMWDLPVELDPHSAAKLGIVSGDRVKVASPHGSLEAWVYVHPAALPGVISMPIGHGHTHYGRYASGRGANPLALLAPVWEESTGVLAAGATRVNIARITPPEGALIQFSPVDREQGPWGR
jgi:anaerobic selenocysteine-containing dehydrogenase